MEHGFETWYRETHPRVVRALTAACGDREAARDAAATAFVKSYERWRRVGSMQSPDGWVFRVALNEVRRRARRRRRGDELVRLVPPLAADAPSPEQSLAVWDAVQRLPARMREAIALRYLGGLTERECADAMRITEGALSAQLASGRSRLRAALADPSEPALVTDQLPGGTT